jgi:hypothetical protein
MSIYPVRINEWYVKDRPFGKEVEFLECMLPHLKCEECKKPITWDEGYVMHSITYGGPDEAWCSALCLYGEIYEAKADINLLSPNLD